MQDASWDAQTESRTRQKRQHREDRSSIDQLFRVVYDPASDRFLLQDNDINGLQTKKSAWEDQSSKDFPWKHAIEALGEAVGALELKSEAAALTDELARRSTLPELDFSALGAPSVDPASASSKKNSTKKPASSKKNRIRDYTAHFANANTRLPAGISRFALLPHSAGVSDGENVVTGEAPTWNGEPLRVKVACVERVDLRSYYATIGKRGNQAEERDTGGIQHVFELAQLSRIRPHADGFRDTEVNSGCSFAPLTSSSSSEDEVQEASSSSSSSFSDDPSALPEFQRGDRVLFRAKHRRFRGTIARRVSISSFYDVRAANGTLFSAVPARRIRLLPQVAQEPPPFDFQRGDRVLWLPAQSSATKQQSYKARVLRLRSLDRFDIELRTGRVRRKVPYAELRPAL